MHFGSGRLMQWVGNKEIIAKGFPDWQLTVGDYSMERQQQREKCRFGFHLVPNLGFCTKGKPVRRLGFSKFIYIYILFIYLFFLYYRVGSKFVVVKKDYLIQLI